MACAVPERISGFEPLSKKHSLGYLKLVGLQDDKSFHNVIYSYKKEFAPRGANNFL